MQKIFDCKTNKFFTIHNKRGIPTEIEYEFIDGIFKQPPLYFCELCSISDLDNEYITNHAKYNHFHE